ncbi:uncharacterized protein LOC135170241 [Diachasmimorpha longicaudata]|uniref:uncharacterized protein LOC135170241 n=1 Tax=Diachasmimorpha longicaudata TaxID=58733 RepID=UPI0030B8D47F
MRNMRKSHLVLKNLQDVSCSLKWRNALKPFNKAFQVENRYIFPCRHQARRLLAYSRALLCLPLLFDNRVVCRRRRRRRRRRGPPRPSIIHQNFNSDSALLIDHTSDRFFTAAAVDEPQSNLLQCNFMGSMQSFVLGHIIVVYIKHPV